MLRRFMSYFSKGIYWGSTIFIINAIMVEITNSPAVDFFSENLIFQILGYLLFGLTLSFSQIILESERFTNGIRLTVHILVITCAVLILGFVFGWISMDSPLIILIYLLQFAIVYAAVWVINYYYEKYCIDEVNKALKKRDTETD